MVTGRAEAGVNESLTHMAPVTLRSVKKSYGAFATIDCLRHA